MIRLLFPLVVITAGIWTSVYYLNRPQRRKSFRIARQFLTAFGLAGAILVLISLAFYIGSIVNG